MHNMILPWHSIPASSWVHQGPDDRFGLCFYAGCGNNVVILGGDTMPNVEIESAAREIEGFDRWIAATDRGENMEVGFDWIRDKGWPGDPLLRIASWSRVALTDIADTIARRGAAMSGLMLPMNADATNYDFSDMALVREAPGVYGHAVVSVEATDTQITFITWGGPKEVSLDWARKYFSAVYDVVWVEAA